MRALALLCLVPAVAARGQNTFVVPNVQSTASGNVPLDLLTPDATQQPARVQCVWERSQVPFPAGLLVGMDLRRCQHPMFRQLPNPAAIWDISLTMATSPLGAFSAIPTFAANLNPDATPVFQGMVSLPRGTELTVPAPFTVSIPFTAPFPYVPAPSARGLTADFFVRSYVPAAGGIWRFDAQAEGNGSHSCCWVSPLCRMSSGASSNGYSYSGLMIPGQPLWVEYLNLLPNAPGAVAFGTVGPGGTWGGATLPFDLATAGAPGCRWFTSVMLWLPAVCSPSGALRSPNVFVPNDPLLAGAGPYYNQGVVLDPGANSLGAVPTLAASFTLGSQAQPPGTTIARMNDTGHASGTIRRHALVAQFRY